MELKIKGVIGFGGKVANSLKYTPCGNYMVYPLGSFVVIKNIKVEHTHAICFLSRLTLSECRLIKRHFWMDTLSV